MFAWAIDEKLISRNPFIGWRVKVPKKVSTREAKAFTNDEIRTILNATLSVTVRSKTDAAKRWCPWLAAYSGARIGELTQLRGVDIIKEDGIHAMKISPEAGTTKTKTARKVPIHEHLIEQGFIDFVRTNGKAALFYMMRSNQREAATRPNTDGVFGTHSFLTPSCKSTDYPLCFMRLIRPFGRISVQC